MKAIDLFAGAGGFSESARLAGLDVVWAANHFRPAVDAHVLNHPSAQHVCQDLHQANWMEVPSHDVLLASPACQGHTPARGKERQHHDAQRATAWAVVSAAECHRPPVVIVENVPGFMKWVLFGAWQNAMEALGYALSFHVLDAADAGVAQHRVRLFVIATRSRSPLDVKFESRAHKPVRECLDLDQGAWSKVRKPGRSMATLSRIKRGRAEFGELFVMPYYTSGSGLTGRSVERPIGTITTKARWAVVNKRRMRMLTVAETRRVMGFREDYKLPEEQALAVHLLGNAVCPPQGEAVISAVMKRLGCREGCREVTSMTGVTMISEHAEA